MCIYIYIKSCVLSLLLRKKKKYVIARKFLEPWIMIFIFIFLFYPFYSGLLLCFPKQSSQWSLFYLLFPFHSKRWKDPEKAGNDEEASLLFYLLFPFHCKRRKDPEKAGNDEEASLLYLWMVDNWHIMWVPNPSVLLLTFFFFFFLAKAKITV